MNFETSYRQFKAILPVNTEITYTEGNHNICIKFYIPNLIDVLAIHFVKKAKDIFGANFKHVFKGGNNVTITLQKQVRIKKLTAELIILENKQRFKSPSIN